MYLHLSPSYETHVGRGHFVFVYVGKVHISNTILSLRD